MVKDIPVGMDFMFAAHHVICVAVDLYFFFADPPGIFIAGAAVMELGSSTNTLFMLRPNSRAALYIHIVIMSASNMIALFLVMYYAFMEAVPLSTRITHVAVVAGLVAARQQCCFGNVKSAFKTKEVED